MGTALFGHEPEGALNVDVPLDGLKFSEPFPRRLRAQVGGETVADTIRARLLHEHGALPTYWFPREDVAAHLVPSELQTTCAYKGHASWWSVQLDDGLEENLVWSYPEPHHDGEPVRGLLAFLDEQVDVDVDGVRQPRPRTPWSAPRWWEQGLRAPGQR